MTKFEVSIPRPYNHNRDLDESEIREKSIRLDSFRKHRKTLVAISAILTLVAIAGITISGFNASGVSVSIRDPSAVAVGLWFAWAYFLTRTGQYQISLGDRSLRRSHQNRSIQIAGFLAKHEFESEQRSLAEERTQATDATRSSEIPSSMRFEYETFMAHTLYEGGCSFQIAGSYSARSSGGGQSHSGGISADKKILFSRIKWLKLRAALYVALATPLGSEYVAPYVIAVVPVVVWVWDACCE
jgi:hypothetical protein